MRGLEDTYNPPVTSDAPGAAAEEDVVGGAGAGGGGAGVGEGVGV